MSTAPPKSEGAKQHDSNQPRPDTDPVVSEGGDDYKPTTAQGAEPTEEAVGGSATVGEQELDGLDKENILDNETGVQTRGVESDAYKSEKEVDAAVDAAVDGDEGQKQ